MFSYFIQLTLYFTDKQGRERCTEQYKLLKNESVKLTQNVMTATITRITGKLVKTLLNNLTVQDKSKLREAFHDYICNSIAFLNQQKSMRRTRAFHVLSEFTSDLSSWTPLQNQVGLIQSVELSLVLVMMYM